MRTIDIVCSIICIDHHLLIAKRGAGVHENIWEFPGGKVEPGKHGNKLSFVKLWRSWSYAWKLNNTLQRFVTTERIAH